MFGVLILLVILAFGASLTGLVLFIIGLSTRKNHLVWGGVVTAVVGIIAIFITINTLVNYSFGKVTDFFSPNYSSVQQTYPTYIDSSAINRVLEDNRTYLITDSTMNNVIRELRSMLTENEKKEISNDFYTYFGDGTEFRFPLAYPFSIHCIEQKDFGTLVDEKNVPDVKSGGGSEENLMFGVTHMNFDKKMLLLQTTNKLSPEATTVEKISYYIFDWQSKKFSEFNSENEMIKSAKKSGYEGPTNLMTIQEYDNMF
jgi:hypothetical protein